MKHKVSKKQRQAWYAGLSCALLLWMTAPVMAAESSVGENNWVITRDVVVEADKAKEEAKLESQQTTIITAADIAKKQAKSVEDIIFSETGVSRTVDAMGRVTVSIRGAEPRHTLILIDGQPVMGDFAKYSGAGDELQRLGTENVDHIEIIQGAASAKYGSDAIGGVINVITKKAAKTAGIQVNVEGRRAKQDGDIFPYQNFFLRADSGQIGKVRAAIYGSKRETMPIYSEATFNGGMNTKGAVRNSLRYYGDIKNIGMSATYDIDDKNKIDFNIDKTKEDMERFVKHSNNLPDPVVHYKRNLDRNTYRLAYTGNNGGSTDWKVDMDYAKMTENDITISSIEAYSQYEGKNSLEYLDDIMHKQWNMKASANTQINDKHLLTYGFGYSKETGEGSRLKSSPNTTTRYIDPWDYDKNLHSEGGIGRPDSDIRDYAMSFDKKGIPHYDQTYEMYGYKNTNGYSEAPAYTYQDWQKDLGFGGNLDHVAEFGQQLRNENPWLDADDPYNMSDNFAVYKYYNDKNVKWHGKTFNEESDNRINRQTVGRAEIKKQNFYVQDTWQLNQNTILSPIFRVDHSNLFGSNVTFNMGLTHNIGGHANRRFKANIGTGYTEPGMGELYYNWEMYAGMPVDLGIGKLGYYWFGNPDLKPEKSVNFDIGIEGENGKTSTRLNIFHNKIKNYMTTYFTGELMNFHPDAGLNMDETPPDMIYSFKNIGKAEITGAEVEVTHQFDEHWSGKMGYTYLHAINKSDPDMPRQLLDKPQHKVDIGITYENKKGDWRASLWGDYYIHMLDSNTIANDGNYVYTTSGEVVYGFSKTKDWTYEKKTFGLWNILIQKYIDKDSMVYFGIDNLFNHRDDDQAFQERVYKFGVNMKFGTDGHHDTPASKTVKKAKEAVRDKLRDDTWFIQAPFDTEKKEGVEFIGDYQARWNSFTGKVKPSEARVTTVANVGTAYKNYLEKADHGFEQRLRAGIDARIGDNTNITLLGSASGMTGVDTMHDVRNSKGLNHQRMDNIDVTQHAKKWDFSIGRLTEPMGVTGYWFGKEYDGGRAVWTSGKNQVRLGYGDFSQSTGITDSAYTHATMQVFMRPPTKYEWLGMEGDNSLNYPLNGKYGDMTIQTPGFENLYQKLVKAGSFEEEKKIIDQYMAIIHTNDPDLNISAGTAQYYFNSFIWNKITLTSADGTTVKEYLAMDMFPGQLHNSFDKEILQQSGERSWETALQFSNVGKPEQVKNVDINESFLTPSGNYTMKTEFYGYGTYTGKEILQDLGTWGKLGGLYAVPMDKVGKEEFEKLTQDQAKDRAESSLWNRENAVKVVNTLWPNGNPKLGITHAAISPVAEQMLYMLANLWKPEDNSSLPLHFLEQLGFLLPQIGTVLVQDQIPPIDKAVFAQAKHQFGDNFGIQAWYLRSVGDDTHSIAYANGDHNDTASFDQLANVIGLGTTWRIGDNIRLSYDWGQNRTDFGRFMNGNTIYNHEMGTSDFDIAGRSNGGTPRFWVARVDIGKADTDKPGSWNAFADYKYFQHGSFFGGNGTEGVPDRYMDGIKSFTIGGGYVPAKDFLLEAFYTFGAKGIGKRDTLYGPEHFTLGDYTRIQATFKF